MTIIRQVIARLFAPAAGSDELLAGQYQALRRQIPLMYALMFVDAAFLGFAAYNQVSLALSVGVPTVLLVVTVCRALIWIRREDTIPSPTDIRRYLKSTIIAAAVLSCGFGGWGLLLLYAAKSAQMLAVALYIFVGTISCCYCLQPLPAAGRLVLLFGAMPVTIRLVLSGDWYLFGIAANFMIVAALVARTLSTNHRGFIEVVNSRSEMLTEQERARIAEQRAQELAYRDALTGLQNRRALTERLDGLRLQNGGRGTFALLILDLDLFKAVNDVHGHPAGDRLLKHVAQRLEGVVAGLGTPYRLGGDEFAIILEDDNAEKRFAATIAQSLVQELTVPFQIEGLTHHIGASVGLSFFPGDAIDSETLLRRADIALYKAKALGRCRQLAFDPGMDAEITNRSYLERDLRRDLTRGAFRPWYQPIVNLQSGKVTGFEMLARWLKGNRLLVGPDRFIPIAEECGLVGDLMLTLLEQACRDAAEWDPNLVLSINVSPIQLKDRSLAENVAEVLSRTGFPATRLKLEITENALISEPENAKAMVNLLKKEGVRLALDDFGTGFSSIQHLRILPFDNIKIDQSFIMGLEDDADARRMVRAMVRLASSLDLPVVAEGIESHGTLEVLKRMGCAEGQGYLFGKPMEAREIAQLLQKRQHRASGALAA